MSGIGMLTRWTARRGQDAQAGDLLRDALPLVMLESGTLAWILLRFDGRDYGVFAEFRDYTSRRAHLDGPAHRILVDKSPLVFEGQPHVDEADVMAEKLPPDWSYAPLTQGVLLEFSARPGKIDPAKNLFLDTFEAAEEQEPGTTACFALRIGDERFASLAVVGDRAARFAHLTGVLPAELARHALALLRGLPDLETPHVLAAKLGP